MSVLSLPRKAGARWARESIAEEIREVVRGQILEYSPLGPGQGDVHEGVWVRAVHFCSGDGGVGRVLTQPGPDLTRVNRWVWLP